MFEEHFRRCAIACYPTEDLSVARVLVREGVMRLLQVILNKHNDA